MTNETIIGEFIQPVLADIGKPTAHDLFGKSGALDSMGLLSLVVLLEERVNAATGKTIRLVSDQAFSQTRSPFATVDTLADYVAELIA